MLPIILFATLALIVGWFVAETHGRRWMRLLLGVMALVGVGFCGYQMARVVVAIESLEHYENKLLESSMAKMERLAVAGDISAMTKAIAVYNRTLAKEPNGHYRAALEMSSALK